ncbi:tautomerase family protein [Uliginosibacterium sp. H1]|uniref:tautomerase family protein n=1 Tax=Uliginosibacterium sp. H1 TaxID=3114757 RepID=UPI002E17CFE7|nr:tautomerase family protein [Uliginosibacterium sp. H1]
MPLTRIETRRERPAEEVQAIIAAVERAQRVALKLPEGDRQIRYVTHRPEHFAVPADRSADFTVIEITLFSGRSLDAKRQLYALLVDELGALGIARNDVFVVLNEQPQENWGLGGKAACDLELGFKVDV